MGQVRHGLPPKRLVWRMTTTAPLGEFVDPDALQPGPCPAVEVRECGWVQSTFDLLTGLDVFEGEGSLPPTQLEEWFPKPGA